MLQHPDGSAQSTGDNMMKTIVWVFSLFFAVISSVSAQHAPWEKTAGPPGLEVKVIYKANGIVYAGTATQGGYKSSDDGLSWVAANSGIERSEERRVGKEGR